MTNTNNSTAQFDSAAAVLPMAFKNSACFMSDADKSCAEEFRLRIGRRASVVFPEEERQFLHLPVVTQNDLYYIIEQATNHSAHSARESLRSGFLSVKGGHRIGICGTAVCSGGEILTFKDFSSLSIRIAHQTDCVSEEFFRCFCEGGLRSTIIVSPPGFGKTTLLRELIRKISDLCRLRVSFVDERGEIAAAEAGTPFFDIGRQSDFISLCPKAQAIPLLLLSMNPQLIAVDEISADLECLYKAASCGVLLLATLHGSSCKDLERLGKLRTLFSRAVFIRRSSGARQYEITDIY